MSTISEDKINEVRARVDIVQIIGKRVELKKSGNSYTGLCPFHNERTPSFNVMPQKGFYHCFGCQASGDVFKFIVETEMKPFPVVVRDLAKEVGIDIPETSESPEDKKNREKRDFLYKVNSYLVQFYVHQYWESQAGERAHRYIIDRGVTDETAKKFEIGYAPRRADELLDYLAQKKIPKESAIELGALGTRDDGSHYNRFYDRVIFPIYDDRDRVAGFGGRVLEADVKAAKYLNSPDSPVFKKGGLLYGLHKAKHTIGRAGSAWLCEGYLDVIALHQAGLEQAVAPLGTAVTEFHLPTLRRVTQKVSLLFDGDSAGERATRKSTELLLSHGFGVTVVTLPKGDDPDTFVLREGAATMRERVDKSLPAVQFYIEESVRTLTPTVEGRVKAVEALAPLLGKLTSQLERDLYVREAAQKLIVDEASLRRFLVGARPAATSPVRGAPNQQRPGGQPVGNGIVRTSPPPNNSWQHLAQGGHGSPPRPANPQTDVAPPETGDEAQRAYSAEPVAPPIRPPDSVEWSAVIEILKYRVLWQHLPRICAVIMHSGLRQIVEQCIVDDAELTYEDMEKLLGSTPLARNLAQVLSDDQSPRLDPAFSERLVSDVELDLLHVQKRRELQLVDVELGRAQANAGGQVPVELLKKRRDLVLWLKRERPRLSAGGDAPAKAKAEEPTIKSGDPGG